MHVVTLLKADMFDVEIDALGDIGATHLLRDRHHPAPREAGVFELGFAEDLVFCRGALSGPALRALMSGHIAGSPAKYKRARTMAGSFGFGCGDRI